MRHRALIAVFASALISPAAALEPGSPAPGLPLQLGPAIVPPTSATQSLLTLSATFSGDAAPIRQGLRWRIFTPDRENGSRVVAESNDASPSFALPPGEYVVHAAYGLAASSKLVMLGTGSTAERLSIGAGGLVVTGAIGDTPIPAAKMAVSLYIPAQGNPEDKLVTSSLKAGDMLRLPEGTYHVVSTYGDSNSIMQADIIVRAGKVTAATMLHKAASLTLKLVHKEGGEAIADTGWTVLTPGGDVIREAIGAFPSMILAEGDYIAIARHEGRVYQGEFKVRSGLDRDVEVVAKDVPTR